MISGSERALSHTHQAADVQRCDSGSMRGGKRVNDADGCATQRAGVVMLADKEGGWENSVERSTNGRAAASSRLKHR